jgi:PTS system nitrogen regulatory IIA component
LPGHACRAIQPSRPRRSALARPGAWPRVTPASQRWKNGLMGIAEHLSPQDVILDLGASSKDAALQSLAAVAARRMDRPEAEILDALRARERLGSTALGRGVALPHARIEGDAPPVVTFARLHRPIDFEARDEEPVDLVIQVLWPEAAAEGFLPMLAETCRALRDPNTLRRLRTAATPAEVLATLANPTAAGPT